MLPAGSGLNKMASLSSMHRLTARPVLAILSTILALLVTGGWWLWRAHQWAEVRDILNRSAPIISPPMELQFSARRRDTPGNRELLQPGLAAGFWVIRASSRAGELEVLLTREGQRYFSVVGNSIVAGFHAGTRLVTDIDSIEKFDTTRKAVFRYTWTSLHPAAAVLGSDVPATGRLYTGEAMLVRSDDRWRLAHWSMPDFEQLLRKFD